MISNDILLYSDQCHAQLATETFPPAAYEKGYRGP